MPRRHVGKLLALAGVAAVAWGLLTSDARAQGVASFGAPCAGGGCGAGLGSCGGGVCQTHHCPPFYTHCAESHPRICFKCGCPKPICNPCALPNFGYFDTCWRPWPLQTNWSHCSVPPAASYVVLANAAVVPGAPLAMPGAPMVGPQPGAMPLPRGGLERPLNPLPPGPAGPAGPAEETLPQPRTGPPLSSGFSGR